jgi:predicted NBD/HSP70 family sugar kinase
MDNDINSLLAFDLGGTYSKVWCDNREHQVTAQRSLSEADETVVIETLRNWINELKPNALAVGISLPCAMVPAKNDRRILETSTKFGKVAKGKHGGVIAAVEEAWQCELGRRVHILNDGEAAAIDVFEKVRSSGYDHVMVVTLGTSIGVGFIFNGKPYIGPYPSRASHILLDPAGTWCMDENHRGCWKTLAGEKARRSLALNMGFKDKTNEAQGMESEEIADMARNGSKKALLYFKNYAESVARGIATIVSAVPVQCVVVAGGVGNAREILTEPLRERLYRGDLLDPDLAPLIDVVQVESFSVAHGAQVYAHQGQSVGR